MTPYTQGLLTGIGAMCIAAGVLFQFLAVVSLVREAGGRGVPVALSLVGTQILLFGGLYLMGVI